jgi:dienelactone hydrolase
MWDIENRLCLLLSLATGISLLARADRTSRILSWMATATAMWTVLVSAPRFSILYHWRSLVLYVLIFVLSIISVVDVTTTGPTPFTRWFCVGYGIALSVVAVLTGCLFYLLPLPSPCKLWGRHKSIGTISFNVPCGATEKGGDITMQCWFPIQSHDKYPGSYSNALLWTSGHPQHQVQESADMLETLANNGKMPKFALMHLSMMRTNSRWQDGFASIARPNVDGDKYPIAIYSHGLWGWRQIHHSACENLASHGFIVFACDHTPDSMCSRPLGGKATRFAFPTPPDLEPAEERKFFQGGMERRVAQLTRIVDTIQSEAFLSKHPTLQGQLDYDNIHMWGHSYGGGTISSLCCKKDCSFRVKSAVMLDGWIYPVPDEDRRNGFQDTALLKLSAEIWPFGKVSWCGFLL